MKKLLIALLLFISFKSNSQLVIAAAGNAAPAGNYPGFFDIHLKGGYRSVKDTFERNSIPLSFRKNMMLVGDTTLKKVWQYDSLRNKWDELGGGINPASNQTITGNWTFDNYASIGTNKAAGISVQGYYSTILGDWNGNGGGTLVDINDDDAYIDLWAYNGVQIWRPNGYDEGDDIPRMVTKFGNDGSIWAANGNFQINSDGHLDIAEAIDLYPNGTANFSEHITAKNFVAIDPSANDGNGVSCTFGGDYISGGGVDPNGEPYHFDLTNGGVGGHYYNEAFNYSNWNVGMGGSSSYDNQGGGIYSSYAVGTSGFHAFDNTSTAFANEAYCNADRTSGYNDYAASSYYLGGEGANGYINDGDYSWDISADGITLQRLGTNTFTVNDEGAVTASKLGFTCNDGQINMAGGDGEFWFTHTTTGRNFHFVLDNVTASDRYYDLPDKDGLFAIINYETSTLDGFKNLGFTAITDTEMYAISSPSPGMMIYNTTYDSPFMYTGEGWKTFYLYNP